MSANQPDIEQIRKYLNGELDGPAMHRLEKQAQDDPFLMDALSGYEVAAKNQQANLDDLKNRLQHRVTKRKKPVIVLWQVLPIAATVLIAIGLSWLWLLPKDKGKQKIPLVVNKKQLPVFHIPEPTGPVSPAMQPHSNVIASVPKTEIASNNLKLAVNQPVSMARSRYAKTAPQAVSPVAGPDSLNVNLKPVLAAVATKVSATNNADVAEMAVSQFSKEMAMPKITGRVTDAEGHGLPGAKVIVKKSGSRAVTNANGEFLLPGTADKDSVTVQMIGYTTKHLLVNNTDKLNIKLDGATNNLAEVTVTHKLRPADIHNAQPQDGWKSYKAYLHEKAIMPDGETGKVKLKFLVDTEGRISNVRVIRGRSDSMNQKAIAIIVNGPEWYGDSETKLKEVKLKIKFHKS